LETLIPVDYPAAHSMYTSWFAIDDAGEVAFMQTSSDGPAPLGLCADGNLSSLGKFLDKDEHGIPILPAVRDPFPEGRTTQALEQVLSCLSEAERESIYLWHQAKDLPEPEQHPLTPALARRFQNGIAALANPADIAEFSKESAVFRLDPVQPIFHVSHGPYVLALYLLLEGRLLGWRELDASDNQGFDSDIWAAQEEGRRIMANIYGIYSYHASPYSGHALHLFHTHRDAPEQYERVWTPQSPRVGLSIEPTVIEPATARGKEKWDFSEDKGGYFEDKFPPLYRLPGVRFSAGKPIQIANLVPCYYDPLGNDSVYFFPDSGASIIRRNMDDFYDADADGRIQLMDQWRRDAERGDSLAQFTLACVLIQANPPDYESAYQWFHAAAEQAEAIASDSDDMFENGSAAQCCLADLYERGLGVAQDDAQALLWYTRSASKGNDLAQYRLGMKYKNGHGVDADELKALAWLTLSFKPYPWSYSQPPELLEIPLYRRANQGDKEAQCELAQTYESFWDDDTFKRQAESWYRESAQNGHAEAQYCMGKMYMDGGVDPWQWRYACDWLSEAARQGHHHAMGILEDAAKGGDLIAQHTLAYLHAQAQNHTEAFYWRRKVIEQAESDPNPSPAMSATYTSAECHFADMYEHGHGVPQDYAQALHWYLKSAAKDNRWAQYSLGMMYRDGRGVPKDLEQARAWLTKSAEQGYDDAQRALLGIAKLPGH
jgi:TPR repeat protein